MMAGLLPAPSLKGVLDYFALAAGIMLATAVLTGPMTALTASLKKQA
jgi:hypothetical protein